MRHSVFIVLMRIIMTHSSALAQAPNAHTVFHRLENFYSEIENGQIDSAMNLYAPDAQILLPNQVAVKGKRDIRNWWQGILKDYNFKVSPKLVEATNADDMVILQGNAIGQLISRSGGAPVAINIWFMQIYRKQPNGEFLFWRGASGSNPN